MARYYGEMQGNRGAASRMGTAVSGLYGHIRGWHVGTRIDMSAPGDEDTCEIRATDGSAGYRSVPLGYLVNRDGVLLFEPSADLCKALRIRYRLGRKVRL